MVDAVPTGDTAAAWEVSLMFRNLSITLLLLMGAMAAQADVYRWVDEHGEVHYTDRWVPGSELIKSLKSHPASPDADAGQRAAEQQKFTAANDHTSAQLTQENNARAVQQDVAKARDQQCKDAKDRYDKAVVARRIYKPSKDGAKDVDGQPVREYMTDEEIDAYRLQALNEMKELCGSSAKPAE